MSQDKTSQFIVMTVFQNHKPERNDRGRGRFGGNRGGGRFGGRGADEADLETDRQERCTTTCAECGTECEVPFKPNGEKPVYCNDCFAENQ